MKEKEVLEVGQFSKSFFDFVDRRFLGVLSGSLTLHVTFVIYFLMNPISEESAWKSIGHMQKELAKTVKEREALKEKQYVQFEFKTEEKKTLASAGVASKPAPTQKASLDVPRKALADNQPKGGAKPSRRARRGGRVSRAQVASRVSKKGVLAMLTSTSSTASGNATSDLLGDSYGVATDLDEKMSKISGLTSGSDRGKELGNGKGKIRGNRATDGGDLDAEVGEMGEGTSHSFERGGSLVIGTGSPLIEGGGGQGVVGRGQDDIQAVILKHNKSIQHCYERQLKRNPGLRGKVTVRFTITTAGKVSKVEVVASTLSNRSVERCIVSRIRRWNDFGEVDASYGSTTIRQSYAFGY